MHESLFERYLVLQIALHLPHPRLVVYLSPELVTVAFRAAVADHAYLPRQGQAC